MSALLVTQARGGTPARDNAKTLGATLARLGWEARDVEIDLVSGRVVVELHRFDGRWLRLAADDLGRASIERWHRNATIARYRGGPQYDSFEDQFLGRDRCEGARSALRRLCAYVADNPSPGFVALPAADVRATFAPLMVA